MKKILFFLFLIISFCIFSQDYFITESEKVNPLLSNVLVFHEDENYIYRALLFRGGFEHVSASLIIQKYSVDWSNIDNPFKLIKSINIDGINGVYNFDVKSIKKENSNYIFTLDAVHTYLYQDTQIVFSVSKNFDYKILSGEL